MPGQNIVLFPQLVVRILRSYHHPPWDSNPFRGHICSESHIWGIAKSPGTFACIFEQGSRRPPNCCSESIACILAFDAVHAGCMESRRFRKSNFNGCFPKRT